MLWETGKVSYCRGGIFLSALLYQEVLTNCQEFSAEEPLYDFMSIYSPLPHKKSCLTLLVRPNSSERRRVASRIDGMISQTIHHTHSSGAANVVLVDQLQRG